VGKNIINFNMKKQNREDSKTKLSISQMSLDNRRSLSSLSMQDGKQRQQAFEQYMNSKRMKYSQSIVPRLQEVSVIGGITK
jgi:hypothetical protein